MKKLLIGFLALIFSMSLGLSAYAREAKDQGMSNTKEQGMNANESGKFVTKAGTFTYKANDIIGADVQNQDGKSLGTIKDLAVDPKTERVAFVVIGHGGAAGIGEKEVAVPFKSLSLRTDEKGKIKMFVLNMSEDRFSKAPTFDKDSWPDRRSAEKSYRYFGQHPYWTHSSSNTHMKKEKNY